MQNSDSPTKIPIFCGLTATDGFMLLGREKVDKFDWAMLKGKEILGFRPGSTPLLFLEAALRKNGIDPQKDVKLNNNVAIPARVGSWLAGQNQFGIFTEPDPSQLELDGKAHFSWPRSARPWARPTTRPSWRTDKYIRTTRRSSRASPTPSTRRRSGRSAAAGRGRQGHRAEFFPGVNPQALTNAAERYRRLNIWKTDAEDRAESHGQVPGHPGAGQRARQQPSG